jgi:hypothetical protein
MNALHPIDFHDWYSEALECVGESGVFDATLTPLSVRWRYDVAESQPCHLAVIRPLLEASSECLFYGIAAGSPLEPLVAKIAAKTRGRYRLNVSAVEALKESLLWNAHGWDRGSILIESHPDVPTTEAIFSNVHKVGLTLNFRAGHSPAAITSARKAARQRDVVSYLLAASNGVEWMTVIARPTTATALFEIACRSCLVTPEASKWYNC